MMKNHYAVIHYMLILLQILLFIVGLCYKKRHPERFEQILKNYFFLPAKAVQFSDKPAELSEKMLKALGEAYEHPWYKLEGNIKYRQERQNFAKSMKEGYAKKTIELKEYEHASQDDI